MTLKEQNFGIEIELTGITREKAARVIADYFGTASGSSSTQIAFIRVSPFCLFRLYRVSAK